jgi:cytochrome P450
MQRHLKLFSPKPPFPSGFFLRFYKRRLEFLEELAGSNCPIAFFTFAGEKMYLVNEPELIKDVLVSNHQRFKKGRGLERAKIILGEGLLTSEGETHRRQRRIVQPVFQHRYLQNYADIMVNHTIKLCSGWNDGTRISMSEQIMSLTLMIVGECLFGTNVESDTRRIGALIDKVMESFFYFVSPLGPIFRLLGHPKMQDAFAARKALNKIVLGMINARRSAPPRQSDLLSLLFSAQDSDTGSGMSDNQLRDEAMTLFLAGHETTANGLSWTLFLLAAHPEARQRLRAELRSVLDRERPRVAHLGKLTLLDQIIRESLRLYPPAYVIGRRAIEDHRLAGIRIPKGAVLLVSPWTVQRSERYYENPLEFRPERWTAEFRSTLPRFAFFPFGGGPRQCIGEGFAWMEMALVLAVLVRDWDFDLVPGQQIRPKPAMTLRSEHPIQMNLQKVLETGGPAEVDTGPRHPNGSPPHAF